MLSFVRRSFLDSQTTTAKTKISVESYAANAEKVSKYIKLFLFQENKTKFRYNTLLFDSKNEITKCVLRPLFFLCCQVFNTHFTFHYHSPCYNNPSANHNLFLGLKVVSTLQSPFRIYVQLCFRKTI